MPCAAIQVVVAVQNHILGALQRARADMVGSGELVVQGIGGATIRQRGRGLTQRQIDRCDINLVQHLVAALQPADVDGDGDREQQAQHHLVGARAVT